MRVYRTTREGVGILRISGRMDGHDARMLLRSLKETTDSCRGCYILDFQGVESVDYKVFEILDQWFQDGTKVMLSGMNDYLMNVFSFLRKKNMYSVFPNWRKALGHLIAHRGKMGYSTAAGMVWSR
ncbi:MAG: STAS domain-containing protein [Candidatus Krumholzibacteriota bacterium]|nr:STAS domain-containing protein [Candidatus Krumholzibacteriota bacterium]